MKNFNELGLAEPLLQAIEELGYEHPMPVQEEVIPHLLNNDTDLIALAQTGTGKTAAFGLPLLQKLAPSPLPLLGSALDGESAENVALPQRGSGEGAFALILSPTRELCLQIADDLEGFSKYLPDVRILAVYGGANIEPQIRALKHGVDIIVATPGRLMDLMKRGVASPKCATSYSTRRTRCSRWASRKTSTASSKASPASIARSSSVLR